MARSVLMADVYIGLVRGYTEVGLDGWCKGGLGQQRNDGGGCTSMRKRLERVESPGTYVTEWPFLLGPVFFRTAIPCSGGYHLERGGMPLHYAVGINHKKGATTMSSQMTFCISLVLTVDV